jgi:hypothetical protein
MATLGDDLLGTVNKLQDLVFNTIGNDSLDLPQIVRQPLEAPLAHELLAGANPSICYRSSLVHSPPESRRF